MSSDIFPPFKGGIPGKIYYLQNHFKYSMMSSWNGIESYAHNVKFSRIDLPKELLSVAGNELEIGTVGELLTLANEEFSEKRPGYQIGVNGRSGGYFVMYRYELERENWSGFCKQCGRKRFTWPGDCDVCHIPTVPYDGMRRVQNNAPPPGYGFVMQWPSDYSRWKRITVKERAELMEQRDIVETQFDLVRDFDKACQSVVDSFLETCRGAYDDNREALLAARNEDQRASREGSSFLRT